MEVLGIVATAFVLISFLFKQTTIIRIINSVGAAVFVVYGVFLAAWSVVALNSCLIVTHFVYLIKLLRDQRKAKEDARKRGTQAGPKEKSWWELQYGAASILCVMAMAAIAAGLVTTGGGGGVRAAGGEGAGGHAADLGLNIALYSLLGFTVAVFVGLSIWYFLKRAEKKAKNGPGETQA